MMIALLLYCWSRGVRSSRAIERACVEDVACRVIAAHQRPDHATIARFVERHESALADLFGEVLVLCADAGLASVGVIAIDGTKVHANANRDRTMDYEQIARAIVDEAIATDVAETAVHGARRGDELPEVVATTHGRQGWLRAARQRLDQERAQRADPALTARAAPGGQAPTGGGPRRRARGQHQLRGLSPARRDARRPTDERAPQALHPPAVPDGKINMTDPDSRLVHGMRGWIQGYNAQAACNERHLIVAAEVMTASPDFGHLDPMLTAARGELAAAGVTELPQVVVADAGYWHLDQMNEITGQGIPVLIPPDSSRRTNTRPGWNGGAYDFMRSVLTTERGSHLYKQRAQLIEPIFGTTKPNRGFTRFARRGRSAARAEWRLMATTHNLRKLHRHFTTAAN
jgi:hypothetical protein